MRRAWYALAGYVAVSIVATWPLARGLGRDIAWDLGDPVMVTWAIAWDCHQLLAILHGDVSRIATFFDANIFYPAPLTLAYSEHFIAQAVQILPVYAATNNPVLCYNLLFLATFVLSGLGTFLLIRELTGNATAAFFGGLLFAFAPYRIPQSSHLQVLSSQWMPFALYGFTRYFTSIGRFALTAADTAAVSAPVHSRDRITERVQGGRLRPLIGAAAALTAQNLSCAYYLLYFSPFAAAYVGWEIARRRLWRHTRMWAQLVIGASAVALVTAPFLIPYALAQQQLRVERSVAEIARYSADVYSYGTAFGGQWFWGHIANAFPKPEGDLFPGIVPLLFALLGALVWRHGPDFLPGTEAHSPLSDERLPRWGRVTLVLIATIHVIAAFAVMLFRRLTFDLTLFELRMSDANQLLIRAAVVTAILLIVSPRARAGTTAFLRSRGFFVIALVVAAWLSLGPIPRALGRQVQLFGLYGWVVDHVPGFDGMRVPARFATIVTLMLAVLGGYGAALIARARRGRLMIIAASVLFLAESLSLPFVVNGTGALNGFNAPEPRLRRPDRAPAVYHAIARQRRDAVLAELPLGQPDFDVRAMFYSTVHWRRLLNGYSGFFPPHYGQLTVALNDVPRHPAISLEALRAGGATHVLVHEGAYLNTDGSDTTAALEQLGAVEVFRDGTDVLVAMPRP